MARTIFTNANLLDGENPAQSGTTVVVEGDRITATGVAAPAQSSDTVVDLSGLTPGSYQGSMTARPQS